MQWLNEHRFVCFWLVVRGSGIQAAGKKLRLANPRELRINRLEE